MIHKHHIIPKHMGGSDDPSNIVELTIQEHADAHNLLYSLHRDPRDRLAELCLLGQAKDPEAVRIKARLGGLKTGPTAFLGKTHSKESKDKMRTAKLGKPNNGSSIGCLKIVTCPHCGDTGGSGGMRRWHFNNCRRI